LLFTWGSLAFILVAGLMLLHVFQSDVIPYVGYFILAIVGTATLFSLLTWAILREKTIKVAGRVPIVMWTCIVLAGGIAGMAVAGPKIAAETFSTSPYITWTGVQDPSSGITISWITSFESGSSVQYGISRTNLDQVSSNTTATRFHHEALNGLLPNTTYYYQVPGFAVKQFTTAPVGVFNYTFYAWTDHRTNTDITSSFTQPNVVEHMASYAASSGVPGAFSICTGDITSEADDFLSWDTFFDDIAYQDWCANQSMQLIYGNHERAGDLEKKIVKQFFPYPQQADEHFYYSFDYGVAHYIMLDPYTTSHSWASNFTAGQLAWLTNDLATHQSANFTMIFMHPPPWSLSGVNASLATLAGLYDIDLVFCGHHHIYDRQTVAGMEVLTLGLGGNPNSDYRAFPCDTAFARFDVSETLLSVTARFINGTVLDSFTIPA
jgi:uncharacterized repeat protein (TIGR02543 family)